jgi:hypothetical protein
MSNSSDASTSETESNESHGDVITTAVEFRDELQSDVLELLEEQDREEDGRLDDEKRQKDAQVEEASTQPKHTDAVSVLNCGMSTIPRSVDGNIGRDNEEYQR